MGEQRNLGIAVPGAKRLNECWRDLCEAFAARPAQNGDETLWTLDARAVPGGADDWVHRCNSRDVATATIRRAVQDRALPIWLRLETGEAVADPHVIASVSHRTLATGLYLTEGDPKSNLEGRPLWVKKEDWRRFWAETMESRYGEQIVPAAGAETGDALALWLALELRRARTAFDRSRKQQDADCEAKGLRKAGVRVSLALKSASEICVALADATIAKAAEYSAPVASRSQARDEVLRFAGEIASTAIPLAHFVSDGAPPVIHAATERRMSLLADIHGAFQLAEASRFGPSTTKQSAPGEIKERPRLPSDDAIREKMHELIQSGFKRDEAAKHIRTLPDFEAVQNEHARRVVGGTLARGRPKRRKQ